MKQMFVRIKETVAEKLRGLCVGLSPEKRMLAVIEIAPLDIPDIVPADTIPDEKMQEMEDFFNQFNQEENE